METTTLSNGVTIPMLGFGTYRLDSKDVPMALKTAFDAGYRHLDCAHIYGNEPAVGAAIKASGIARKDLFITSKVWNEDQGYDSTLAAFDKTLSDLQLDYLDLYLIHWPDEANFQRTLDTWRALETLYQQKKVRAIGVSNFSEKQLQAVFDMATVNPMVNQIERHPYKVQTDLGHFDTEHAIVNEGYSPIGHGHLILEDPVITKLAQKYGKTPAQIVLRWHLDTGFVVFPKSAQPAHVKSNFEIEGFHLTTAEITEINALDRDKHLNYD